jgi:hypothetical protein
MWKERCFAIETPIKADFKNAADAGDITTVQQLNWASTKFKVTTLYH